MSNIPDDSDWRIAKTVVMLYVRKFIYMIAWSYSSRVVEVCWVLKIVVGGVAMICLLNRLGMAIGVA